MEVITEKTGRPSNDYTNTQWQEDFARIKASVLPVDSKRMKTVYDGQIFSSTYHGKTQYQYYCCFINDILENIRHGNTDYCFAVYQIADLLKYEHDRLQAKWSKRYHCFFLTLKN